MKIANGTCLIFINLWMLLYKTTFVHEMPRYMDFLLSFDFGIYIVINIYCISRVLMGFNYEFGEAICSNPGGGEGREDLWANADSYLLLLKASEVLILAWGFSKMIYLLKIFEKVAEVIGVFTKCLKEISGYLCLLYAIEAIF